MLGGGEDAIINEWKTLASAEPDAKWRGEMGGLALVFANLAGRQGVWLQSLKGWNMKESVVVLEWQREAVVERLRAMVLRGVELRYKAKPPADLVARSNEIEDPDELQRWVEATFTCDTLDSFRDTIGQPVPGVA